MKKDIHKDMKMSTEKDEKMEIQRNKQTETQTGTQIDMKVGFANVKSAAILFLLASLVFSTTLLVSCNQKNSPVSSSMVSGVEGAVSSSTGVPQKITMVLDWAVNTNHIGLFVAQEKGYFAQENIAVEFVQAPEMNFVEMVGADSAQFGICGQEQLSQARVSGKVPVVAIAAILQHNTSGFASPADRKIVTPKDFEGKKYSGWGTPLEEKFISTLMQKSSGDFKKVEMRMMGATDFFASMETEADFAWIYYGWDGIGAKTKKYPLNFILLQDVDPVLDFYSPVIISNEKTLHDNPEMVKKFMNAVARGYKDAVNNPEEACDLLLKHTEGTDRALAIESTRYLAGYFMDENQRFGVMKESIWQNFSQWMLDNKLLDSKLDITTSYTNQYLP